jgi:hypothetical protein
MKFRIAIWAGAGFCIAAFWVIYFSSIGPGAVYRTNPLVWRLAQWSCPIAVASLYFHFPVSYYWAILANAATYATAGLIIEAMRRTLRNAG